MRNWQRNTPSSPQEVAVLLFPRFSNLCLANAVEPLRAANDMLMQDFYRWTYVTIDGAPVTSSSGLPVLPHQRLSDHPGGTYLFVASSYDAKAMATHAGAAGVRAAARRFQSVIGMDTGAWIMASAGLLEGGRATIHRDELTAFAEAFPSVEAVSDRFVLDGFYGTCGGAMATFDLVMELIRQTHGEALRLQLAAFFLHQVAASPPGPINTAHCSPMVEAAVALMSDNLEERLGIASVADRIGTNQRALGRAFQAELGAAPMTVYKALRLAAARRYAQGSSYSVAEIALRCGYRNAAAMTRAFVSEYGVPPSALRRHGR